MPPSRGDSSFRSISLPGWPGPISGPASVAPRPEASRSGHRVGRWSLAFASFLLLLLEVRWSEAFMRLATRSPPSPIEDEARPKADYVISNVWQNRTWKRAIELDPLGHDASPMVKGDDLHVRKLLVPMRVEDVTFLRRINLDQLQVDLWPHRDPTPHVHVRIQTNAIMLPRATPHPVFFWRIFGESQTWLTLFEAIVGMSKGVALMNCRSDWRWADLNETQANWRQALVPPIRILEVTCPLRPKGFLLPGPIMGPPAGPQNWRDVVMTCCRFAFVAILVMVCVAQVILLMGCIAMLVMQIGMQWRVIQ